MLLKPGEHISGAAHSYEIVEILGQGTYGTVFRARDEDANFVVIKQLFDTGSASPEDFEYQRKLFWREAEILSQINNPKIVRFVERIPDAATPPADEDIFLVMELVQGQTLRKVFDDYRINNNSQPFPAETVTAVGIEICDALHYLHTLPGQIIYRDLKPENVMWDSVAQKCKLIDFGTARFSDKSRRATQGLGTEGYAPPELYSSRSELSFSTDVFTIGALMYELLTGETPEPKSVPSNFRGYDARIPPALQKVILTALATRPDESLSNRRSDGRRLARFTSRARRTGVGRRRRAARHQFAPASELLLRQLRRRAAHRQSDLLRQMSRPDSHRHAARRAQKRAADLVIFAKIR